MSSLADRYAAPPVWQRPVLLGAVGLVVLAFLGWLGWTMWSHTHPEVDSALTRWEVLDAHHVQAEVQVDLADGVRASCIARATATDYTTVGELTFTPTQGRNEVTIRTEREATSVTLLGCTAPGQPRPR